MPNAEPSPPSPDEINRLWQHGMHEERLFHDRLNYFSFLETGLLTVCVILYNKDPSIVIFLPLAVVALLLTLLWFVIQLRHWAYVEHVHVRIRELVPEYRATVEAWAAPGRRDGLSISKPLALAVPALFACTWIAFFVWLMVRADAGAPTEATVTPERGAILVLGVVAGWLALRVRRLERLLRSPRA